MGLERIIMIRALMVHRLLSLSTAPQGCVCVVVVVVGGLNAV